MPGGFCDSVATGQQIFGASDWTKKGGSGASRRFFGDFLCVQKVTRVRAGEARELSPEGTGFGSAGVEQSLPIGYNIYYCTRRELPRPAPNMKQEESP